MVKNKLEWWRKLYFLPVNICHRDVASLKLLRTFKGPAMEDIGKKLATARTFLIKK